MLAIANWLAARPQNAVFGLVVTLLLPVPQLVSGTVMVLLVISQGAKLAALEAVIATLILVVISLVLKGPALSVIELAAGTWVPIMLLALTLVTLRSLTLTIQVSVIVAVLALVLFNIVVSDPAAYWQPHLDAMMKIFEANGLQFNIDPLTPEIMTISTVLVLWMLYTVALLFGYSLHRRMAADTAQYGRFSDLNLGRVIAVALALVSLLAIVIDASLLQGIAFILFAVFTLQGLAIVHWLHSEGKLPFIALVSMYILLPLLQVLLVIVLALVGYTDAWINFRHRMKQT